ncbi:protein disulfide oxidoreductase [Endozoicomonas sp. OPT23]|uniref:protein disulfide oxidoreductase n=1 Tax=Endozoicomonas sp. OPT23 TaxID=2072845 RepID=UPI00129A2B44|nr:protein disulfide oxidoreductase [Endozoicomonas sp. OPT23]MRI33544.1 protein disulfide oxidoreductase [Endozoicomonas sp. OPT23]
MAGKAKRILKEIVVTLTFAAVFMTGYNLYLQKDMPSSEAPALMTTDINGQLVDLRQSSSEKPVLLYFWATWCHVCSWTSPAISDLSEDYEVVTVALASGRDQKVAAYAKSNKLKFPIINDDSGQLSSQWQVSVTPSIFIIKDGEIKSITTGFTTKAGLLTRLWFYQ